MTLKFIKSITSEGKRRVINVPKKHHDKMTLGKKVLVSEIDYKKMTKEELEEILEQ